MKYILNKLKNKKNRSAYFVCSLSFINKKGKIITVNGKIYGKISRKILGKKDLDMIQFLFQVIKLIHLDKCQK